MYAAHPHDLFYITVKYHGYSPKGIQVTERTQICIKKHQRGDNSKRKRELSFLYRTLHHDLFNITVKYHQNIPNGIQVIEQTQKCLGVDGRTDRQDGCLLTAISPEPFSLGIHRILKLWSRQENASETIKGK